MVVKVRRRRSREETEQLVAEYEASGLRQVEFCRKQGLSLATLARYRKRQTQGSPAFGNRWVEVKGVRRRPMQEDGARSVWRWPCEAAVESKSARV